MNNPDLNGFAILCWFSITYLNNATDIKFSQQYSVDMFLLIIIWTHYLLYFIIYHS